MQERSYCYRKLWKKPITIHSLGNGGKLLTFPRPIEVRQVIVALLIFTLMIAFRQSINPIVPDMIQVPLYLLIPWYVSGCLVKMNIEGKRLDRFILGSLLFMYRKRYSYSNQKAVYKPQMMKKQSYEKFEVK